MFKLDEKFLAELGLGGLPKKASMKLLGRVYQELEARVGESLTKGMSDDLLDEFGCFVDTNVPGMEAWYNTYLPSFRDRDDYQKLRGANPDAPEEAVMSEYGAMKWLQLNRPDYPQVVSEALDDIRLELAQSSEAIRAQLEQAEVTVNIEAPEAT